MALTDASDPRVDARRRRTVVWVVGLATLGLIFDGYDLVVYGAVVPTFLRDPSQIGHVSPAMAGALGSYALVGVLVGALLAGAVGDIIGRRKVMLDRLRVVRDRNGRNRVDEHCIDVWTAAVSDRFGRGCPGGNDGCAGSRVCPAR